MSFTGLRTFIPAEEVSFGTVSFYTRGRQPSTKSGTDSKPPPDSYIPFWTDPRPGRKLFIVSNFSGRSRDFVYQLPVWGRGSPVRFYSAPGTSCTSSHCGDAGALFVFTQPQGLCDPAPLSGTREPLTKFSEHPELWINPPSVSSNFSPAAAGEK